MDYRGEIICRKLKKLMGKGGKVRGIERERVWRKNGLLGRDNKWIGLSKYLEK